MSEQQRHESSVEAATKIAMELKLLGQSLARVASRILSTNGIEQVARAMHGASDVLNRIEETSTKYQSVLREVQSETDQAFAELEADLRDALRAKGWRIDGQWPNFIIERALDVRIDESKRSVEVAGRKLPVASVKSIVEALTPEVDSLLPKGFDAGEFLERIALTYDSARGSMTTVPILDIYRGYVIAEQKPRFWRNAVEDRFQGISADQFRARLSKLLEGSHVANKDGRTLRLLPPLDPKDAIFVYQPAEGRFAFVGRIEFTREV
jgi:hypothetical protein